MKLNLPSRVKIVEVGPRDGLQNETTLLKTADKFEYIRLLVEAGLSNIEVTSFVRASRVPQMSDAEELLSKIITSFGPAINFMALVPNLKGMQAAIKAGVSEIAIFTASSESFNRHNINATIEESFIRFAPICDLAKKHQIKIRGYVSTVFGCPYEGKISLETTKNVITKLKNLGAYEISLGDTTGMANPDTVNDLLNELKKDFDLSQFAMHFHDLHGLALTNVFVSMLHGIDKFDSASGGLGGCPYALGAPGNLATEKLVFMLEQLGIKTDVKMDKLIVAEQFIFKKLKKKPIQG